MFRIGERRLDSRSREIGRESGSVGGGHPEGTDCAEELRDIRCRFDYTSDDGRDSAFDGSFAEALRHNLWIPLLRIYRASDAWRYFDVFFASLGAGQGTDGVLHLFHPNLGRHPRFDDSARSCIR